MENINVEVKSSIGTFEKVCLGITTVMCVAVGGLIFYDRFR